jgi:hypothetical protein
VNGCDHHVMDRKFTHGVVGVDLPFCHPSLLALGFGEAVNYYSGSTGMSRQSVHG